MGTVYVDISMSLDGFIAEPNDDVDRLHDWLYGLKGFREPHGMEGGTTDPDSEVIDEAMNRSGAVIVGRRMYELAGGWGDNPPFHKPVFVLTHQAREPLVKEGGTTFTFVTDGAASALAHARAVAGDRDISIGGGASTVQQYLGAGLVDEMQIHIVPVLLGAGIRLFEGIGSALVKLETTTVVQSPAVTHLRFRVLR
jgi:dihydrofolate reductase